MRSDRFTATERAMLHTARARAFGKMRDVANTLRAVGEADAAFEQSDPAQDPPWMAYYDYAQHHGDTAHALFDLVVRGICVAVPNDVERDVDAIRLPRWGRVEEVGGVVPYEVQDPDGQPIEPVRRYLRDFVAQGRSAGSVRSYAYDLLRWWRWLQVLDVEWDKVTSAEVREFVLWLQRSTKPHRTPRTKSAGTAGTITRKQYLGDQYAARTIRHSKTVI